MTQKHFIEIAAVLKAANASRNLCMELCAAFKQINPRFDYDQFLTACGHLPTRAGI